MTSSRKTVPAACDEDGSNLESDETRPVHHLVPAVPRRDPLDQCEPVVPHHVSEAPDTFVACSPVELDQDLIVVVAHIADVSQSVSAPLPISARQPVWTFDIVKEPHLQRRLCARCHVTQDVGEELSVRVAAARVQSLVQPARCGPPALDRFGDQRDKIGCACRS